MAGTLRGRIDCKHASQSGFFNAQEIFTNLYAVLNGHPNLTRKALYYGVADVTPGANALGTGFWNTAAGFGTGAFAVFTWGTTGLRPYTFDMLIQYSGTAPAAAALPIYYNGSIQNNSIGQVGVAVAMSVGGNPWGGTTLNNGTDSKSNPVWVLGGGSRLIVMPATNSAGEVRAADKSNMTRIHGTSSVFSPRVHIMCDDDYLSVCTSDSDSSTSMRTVLVGPYAPAPARTTTRPMVVMFNEEGLIDPGVTFAASSAGIVPPDSVIDARGRACVSFRWYGPSWARQTDYQPGGITASRHEVEIDLASIGSIGYGVEEYLGRISDPYAGASWNMAGTNTRTDLLRSYFNTSVAANDVLGLPWNGVTTPGTTVVRTGVTI